MDRESLFVGVDVSKARLDIGLWPTAEGWSVPNDEAGIAELVSRLQEVQPLWLCWRPRVAWLPGGCQW